jgi:hypothetical protein
MIYMHARQLLLWNEGICFQSVMMTGACGMACLCAVQVMIGGAIVVCVVSAGYEQRHWLVAACSTGFTHDRAQAGFSRITLVMFEPQGAHPGWQPASLFRSRYGPRPEHLCLSLVDPIIFTVK